MELADRDKRDDELAASIFLLFGEQRSVVERHGLRTDWSPFAQDIQRTVADSLEDTFAEAALLFILFIEDTIGRPDVLTRDFAQPARSWAQQQGALVATGIARTSAPKVAEAIRTGEPDAVKKQLDTEFSQQRARTIAVTETTRAVSFGEAMARKVAEASGLANVKRRIWKTQQDERVCPICKPLHRKDERNWNSRFPAGPPAHPRCACGLDYLLIFFDPAGQVVDQEWVEGPLPPRQ